MGHRAYTETGTTDAFGNVKKRPAFGKKAFKARPVSDIGGAAYRRAVQTGSPVNTLSIPSAMGMTVPYQAATGEQVRAAFGVVLHHVPLKTEETKPVKVKTPKAPKASKGTRLPVVKITTGQPDEIDRIKRCACCGEPVNGCFNL